MGCIKIEVSSYSLSSDQMQWMHQVAQEHKVPKHGFAGVLLVDGMSIQNDLQIERTGSLFRLTGLLKEVAKWKSSRA